LGEKSIIAVRERQFLTRWYPNYIVVEGSTGLEWHPVSFPILTGHLQDNVGYPGAEEMKTYKEDLSQYVQRVMKEKHLSRHDVKLRSGGEITDSYVSGIISGTATNLSIQKLKALAWGLRVDERELIRVAFGLSKEREALATPDQSHNLMLVDITKKSVLSTDLAEIVHEIMKLLPVDRAVVLRFVKKLSKGYAKTLRKRRSI
jgi:transcriptional regulator with XRE-family HTH domain